MGAITSKYQARPRISFLSHCNFGLEWPAYLLTCFAFLACSAIWQSHYGYITYSQNGGWHHINAIWWLCYKLNHCQRQTHVKDKAEGILPHKKFKKKKKNTALCVYIYLTEYFKIKRTNEIRKEINKKIEKRES